jgi:hypothetical protein
MKTAALVDRILASPEFVERPPVLVDVGASGGIHAPWAAIARHAAMSRVSVRAANGDMAKL